MEDLFHIIKTVKRKDDERNYARRSNGSHDSEISEEPDDTDSSVDSRGRKTRYSDTQSARQEQRHVIKVHGELCDIKKSLQHESNRLKNWDMELQKRESHIDETEKKLSALASSLQDTVERETLKRCAELEKGYEMKLLQLQEESKKTRNTLKITRKTNETLKTKLAEAECKLKKYEGKNLSSQSRISNLQRKIELLNQQVNDQAVEYNNSLKEKTKAATKSVKDETSLHSSSMFHEALASLLQWISISHLQKKVASIIKNGYEPVTDDEASVELTNDRALKLIIFMPNVLSQVTAMTTKSQLAFVQFLYWSMLHLHLTQYQPRLSHSATYRRIGEELFRGSAHKQGKENTVGKAFFKSSDYSIRILSSLIILHTVNQADILVHVFQSLSCELKGELSKELFLEYRGTEMLYPLFKLTNKVYLTHATDILMILAVDSPYMSQFLIELGTIEWVEAIMTILKASVDITLMENLSLILQRLSKTKGIKPIFDALQVKSDVTDIMRHPNCDGEYLQLNLRSILLNIESMKSRKEK